MKWKLFDFFKKKNEIIIDEAYPYTKIIKGNNSIEVLENGKVNLELNLNLFGKDETIALTTSFKEAKQYRINASDSLSCESEPNESEIKIPVKGFFETYIASIVACKKEHILSKYGDAKINGFNYFLILKTDWEIILDDIEQDKIEITFTQNKMSMADDAWKHYKSGNIERAIEIYEKIILLDCSQHFFPQSYYKLMRIYRKKNDTKNEIRIISLLITGLCSCNTKKLSVAIQKYPEHKIELINCLINYQELLENGTNKIIFSPHDLKIHQDRLKRLLINKKLQ